MYNISLRFNLSVDLFLGLCLGSWRYHCSEGWGSCVILNGDFFFGNIGPGVGIRMLGLAVLKFFLLAYGGCPLQGLLPMSIPMGLVWGFHHHLALFPHFLFADS